MGDAKTLCPSHGPMSRRETQYGPLWRCGHPGCTVKRWGGSTSLPADQETCTARNQCHRLFDPLWQNETGPFCKGKRKNKRGVRKDRAYWWLASTLGIKKEDAHFGMFNLEQCQRALVALKALALPRDNSDDVKEKR